VYAIFRSGGKQYRVEQGETVYLERLETPVGEQVKIEDVLLVGGGETVHLGSPVLKAAAVIGTVVEQARDRKIRIFKYKRRKGYRRTKGHRQSYTAVKIDSIEVGA